ncbi:MAG: hypothetical protein KF727_14395 [Microbacteriaceae bacterium]|nr:hypothetical protein [Microbacteriaceae bacterium]
MSNASEPTRDIRGISALARMTRPAAAPTPTPASVEPVAVPAPVQPEPKVEAAPTPAPEARPKASKPPVRPSAASSGKKALSTRVRRDVGERARAAFLFAGHLEGATSFSAFVEDSLLREAQRYEKRHNDGEPFGAGVVAGRLPAASPAPVVAGDSPKEDLGTRISAGVSDRARAAFRFAGMLEGVASFSEFVEKALDREAERYEKRHNGGEPFEMGAGGRLPAGRPLRR